MTDILDADTRETLENEHEEAMDLAIGLAAAFAFQARQKPNDWVELLFLMDDLKSSLRLVEHTYERLCDVR